MQLFFHIQPFYYKNVSDWYFFFDRRSQLHHGQPTHMVIIKMIRTPIQSHQHVVLCPCQKASPVVLWLEVKTKVIQFSVFTVLIIIS